MKNLFSTPEEEEADRGRTRPTVAIVGAGPFGRAMVKVARRRGCEVVVWSRRPEAALADGARYVSLDELGRASRLIIFCAPAAHARPLLRQIGDVVDGGHRLIHAARGFEAGTTLGEDGAPTVTTVSMIVRQETPIRRVGVLAGPLVPRELEEAIPSAIVVASRFPEVPRAAQDALAHEALRVYGSDDLVGVELAAALMTVVALSAGLVTGLGGGISTRALMVARGIAQAARVLEGMGARSRTLAGLGGVGEVFVTAQGVESPDYDLGVSIAAGAAGGTAAEARERLGRSSEGPSVARCIAEVAAARGLRAPLFGAVSEICSGKRDPREALREFFVSAPTEV